MLVFSNIFLCYTGKSIYSFKAYKVLSTRLQVYAGAVFCGEVKYEAGKNVYEINCGGAVGRSIVIKQPYNYLTLCEVQAFGEPSDEKPLKNVADGKQPPSLELILSCFIVRCHIKASLA